MSLPSLRWPVLCAGAAILLLGGCANLDQVLDSQLDTVEFDCDNDRDIRVAFLDGGDEARVFSGDSSVDLRLVDRRDGGDVRIYENRDGSVRMMDDGDQIDMRVSGKENFEDCEPQGRRRGNGGRF